MTHTGFGDDCVAAVVGDHAECAVDGFFRFGLCKGSIGIADAHCKAKAQGVRELYPPGGVAAIDKVVVFKEFRTGCGNELKGVDGFVQFVKELLVHLVLGVVQVGERTILGIGDGAVVVGNLMHGGNLQHLCKCKFVHHSKFLGFFFKYLEAAKAVLIFHNEHLAVPAVVHVPAGVVAVAEGGSHISAPGLCTEVVHDLVVGVQISSVAVDNHGALKLLEHTAHGKTVLGHLFVGNGELVVIEVLKAFYTSAQKDCGEGNGSGNFKYLFHSSAAH